MYRKEPETKCTPPTHTHTHTHTRNFAPEYADWQGLETEVTCPKHSDPESTAELIGIVVRCEASSFFGSFNYLCLEKE